MDTVRVLVNLPVLPGSQRGDEVDVEATEKVERFIEQGALTVLARLGVPSFPAHPDAFAARPRVVEVDADVELRPDAAPNVVLPASEEVEATEVAEGGSEAAEAIVAPWDNSPTSSPGVSSARDRRRGLLR